MQCDLLIRGGHVVDPASGRSGVADVAIAGDKILAVDRTIAAEARQTIDASGYYVTPGLIDLHTHVFWGSSYWGIEADPVAANTGVTTWLDVGTSGAYNFSGFRRFIIEPAKAKILALLNISGIGLTGPTYELSIPEFLEVDLARTIVEGNRDLIVGIKARIDQNTTRGVGLLGLERARELADQVELPLMVHIARPPPELPDIIRLMKPGDILTHCFTGHGHRVIGPDRQIIDYVKRAWDSGIVFDIGHGAGSFSFETSEAMLAQGLLPDVISTDIHQLSIQGPMFDMPTTLSKFLALGLSLEDVVSRATDRAARALGRPDLGKLEPGAVADVAVFRLDEGSFTYYDVFMNERKGTRRLRNTATIRAGELMARTAYPPLQPWAPMSAEELEPLNRPDVRPPD